MTATPWPRQIEAKDELLAAIAVAERAGSIGWACLGRALAAGRVAFWPMMPDASANTFKAFARGTAGRPAVVLIGDDDGLDRGPAEWSQAQRAVRWAASILLHSAGAELAHYETVIEAAQVKRRVLVVECGTRTLPQWLDLVRRAPQRPGTVIIVPKDGAPHPRPLQRGQIQ